MAPRETTGREAVGLGALNWDVSGLPPGERIVLLAVQLREPVTSMQVAETVAAEPKTVQSIMQRLKRRNLVAGRPDPTDPRRSVYAIADGGDGDDATVEGAVYYGRE